MTEPVVASAYQPTSSEEINSAMSTLPLGAISGQVTAVTGRDSRQEFAAVAPPSNGVG
jgi:hypothetical protein